MMQLFWLWQKKLEVRWTLVNFGLQMNDGCTESKLIYFMGQRNNLMGVKANAFSRKILMSHKRYSCQCLGVPGDFACSKGNTVLRFRRDYYC